MKILIAISASLLLLAGVAGAQTLSNEDLIKLSKANLSESFVLGVIEQQGESLNTDVSSLIALKTGGVNERLINAAIAESTTQTEPLNTDSVLRLVQAGFSDSFILKLIDDRDGQFATNTSRIIELNQAGVSEQLLQRMLSASGTRTLAEGTEITIRLIDAVDSERDRVGDTFRASLDQPMVLDGATLAARGADATVQLVDAEESGRIRGRTALTLRLVAVEIDGKMVEINSTSVSQTSGSRGERTAKSAATVGAIGAVIGAIAGGGKGAAIGAAAGAGAGAGAQIFLDPQKVQVPSESLLTFTLERPTTITGI